MASDRVLLLLLLLGCGNIAFVTAIDNVAERGGIFLQDDGDLCINSPRDILFNSLSLTATVSRLSTLEQTNAVLSASVSDMTAQNSAMTSAVSSLTAHNSVITAKDSELSADVSSLKAQNSLMTAQNIAMASLNSAMAADISTLKVQNSALAASNAQFAMISDTLKKVASWFSSCASALYYPQSLAGAFESFATFSSADGTVFMIAEQEIQSMLYKSDEYGSFVSYQTLWSADDASRVHAFNVGSAQYVALPFNWDGTTRDYRCELFVFNESTKLLVSVQNISTMGVSGVSAITAQSGVTYLAVANSVNDPGSRNIPSYIMRFNNATKLFEHFQNITTHGANPPEFFQFGTDTFLAIPNNNDGSSFLQNSVIYKLNPSSGTFSLNQSIPTNGCRHMKPWTRNSQLYLSVVNQATASYIDTLVFDSMQGQFVNILNGSRLYSINTNGADVIDIANETYMAVSPSSTYALIYKWSDAHARFDQIQSLPATSGYFYPRFFTVGNNTYLALADHIYKFCDTQFVLG
jgi:hypothetical protein